MPRVHQRQLHLHAGDRLPGRRASLWHWHRRVLEAAHYVEERVGALKQVQQLSADAHTGAEPLRHPWDVDVLDLGGHQALGLKQ